MAAGASVHPDMVMYNYTLQKSSAITNAVFGSFSAPRAQEIVVSRGKILELLAPDDTTGKVMSLYQWECFGIIRIMRPFRLPGGKQDYLVVGSDSGLLMILQYDKSQNKFVPVQQHTFGKSGCRRIVPGEQLAVDPKGRAVMIGALEKQKFVYVLNRDAANKLTISSPLEAHKSNTITWDICGVDVGFENPVFAAIEVDYREEEEMDEEEDEDGKEAKEEDGPQLYCKQLTYYELDLGLNHVTRKWSDDIDPSANCLISVPGGADGPGGVVFCAENYMVYKDQDHAEVRTPIPRRFGSDESKGTLITCTATHRQKNLFFFLVQSEFGDIYKVSLEWSEEEVTDLTVKYFDTVPPCISMCVLKTGFLFCASEFGNHYLFQFQGIGAEEDVETNKSTSLKDFMYFSPRPLKNLVLIDEMDSLSPIMDMKVADLTMENAPQIYTLCGRGARSSLRVLRHGLAVSEMAVSELPGNPNAVWAVSKRLAEEYHKYIVVSFVNATIVLSIGDTVTEVSDSGVLDSTPTLSMSTLGRDSLLQIHPGGLRHIRSDMRINQWKCPVKKEITRCAVNNNQVVISLTGGELVYFELDSAGMLMELARKQMGNDVAALAIAPLKEGQRRSEYMAVGGYDNTVRVLSLHASEPMTQSTVVALPEVPSSLCLARIMGVGSVQDQAKMFLYIGLQNGVMIRAQLDVGRGSLSDQRKKFLGTKPVKLFTIKLNGNDAVMALSTRSWMSYSYQGRFNTTPLSYEELEYSAFFASAQCPEGIVCISGNTLRIVTLERLGEDLNQTVLPLRYTPRKMVVNPLNNHLIVIESDHRALYPEELKEMQATFDPPAGDADVPSESPAKRRKTETGAVSMDAEENKEDDEERKQREAEAEQQAAFLGPIKAGAGTWASCIRVLDPHSGETTCLVELKNNEAAFSMCILTLPVTVTEGQPPVEQLFLAVGTAQGMQIVPRKMTKGYIHLYRFTNNNTAIELLHKTPTEDVVLGIAGFQHRVVAGVGSKLTLYELGKRKLLRKCQSMAFPSLIQCIHVYGERIYVGDVCEAFHMVKYITAERAFHVFADNDHPFYLTSSCVVDYNTLAGTDKFGNVFLCRLPADANEDKVNHMATTTWGNTLVTEAPNKLEDLIHFHVGETITSIQKTQLGSGLEVLVYSTIMGSIGVLVPFSSREDVEFFSHLEMHLRQELPPLLGRDHMAFRSYYFPVKECIDGDLCEQFGSLPQSKQGAISEEMVSTPADVAKRLEEMRSRVM